LVAQPAAGSCDQVAVGQGTRHVEQHTCMMTMMMMVVVMMTCRNIQPP
jgi:hypothetical protein